VVEGLSARHRVIGRVLREFRQGAGLPLEDAAAVLGCDKSKVSRVEDGERGIAPGELAALLEAYDAGPAVRDALVPLSRVHGAGGWWDEHPGVLRPGELDLAVAESAALRIWVHAPLAVPALLQAEPYIRLAAAADPRVAEDARNRVIAARLARTRAVLSRRIPLEVVIGAAALHLPVPDDVVIRAQARHLAEIGARWPQVRVRILPTGMGVQAVGGAGGFTVAELCREPLIAMVHADGVAGGWWPESAAAYLAAFERLPDAALSPGKSIAALRQLAQGGDGLGEHVRDLLRTQASVD
jgi:transcriptional regulator with XRE-family HTH domain